MNDIDMLISQLFDDALSDEQFAQLQDWINESEQNAIAFALASSDHSSLRELCRGDLVCEIYGLAKTAQDESLEAGDAVVVGEIADPANEGAASRPSVSPPALPWKSDLSAALQFATFAAAVLVGVIGTLSYQQMHREDEASPLLPGAVAGEPLDNLPPAPVARLVDFGGDLQTDLLVPRNGSELQRGQVVTISNGFGNLSFGGGAKLQLEGPLALTVGGPADSTIKYGRLIAESGALEEFRVATTLANVVAFPGSTMGVATFGEVMNVMAIKGPVRVEALDAAGGEVLLHEGESYRLHFTPSGSVKHYYAELSSGDFPLFKSTNDTRLVIPEDYVEAVTSSAPLAYWRFDRVLDETVFNEIDGGPDLSVFGNLRFQEAAGNSCVDFGLHTDTGFLATQTVLMPEGTSDYSIELWANPTHCHSGVLVSLADTYSSITEPERHGLLLEFEGPGHSQWAVGLRRRLRFLHRPQLSENAKDGTNLHPPTEYVPGHWHHICAVRSGHALRLHVDGQQVASGEDPGALPAGLSLKIGQLYLSAPVRQFAGQIDEVAIYDRALPASEVLNHYQHVREH